MSEKPKPTGKKGKKEALDRENDARLGVWIDSDIDEALRKHIASENTTKRQAVEKALRQLLNLPKQDARALA